MLRGLTTVNFYADDLSAHSLMTRFAAISAFDIPAAIARTTSSSRVVRAARSSAARAGTPRARGPARRPPADLLGEAEHRDNDDGHGERGRSIEPDGRGGAKWLELGAAEQVGDAEGDRKDDHGGDSERGRPLQSEHPEPRHVGPGVFVCQVPPGHCPTACCRPSCQPSYNLFSASTGAAQIASRLRIACGA